MEGLCPCRNGGVSVGRGKLFAQTEKPVNKTLMYTKRAKLRRTNQSSDTFRSWARKFPALVSCSAIDVFSTWPQDALVSVAQNSLKSIFVVDKSDDHDSENSLSLESMWEGVGGWRRV